MEFKQSSTRTWGTSTNLTNPTYKKNKSRHTISGNWFQKNPIKAKRASQMHYIARTCVLVGESSLPPLLWKCWLSAGLIPHFSPPCSCTHLQVEEAGRSSQAWAGGRTKTRYILPGAAWAHGMVWPHCCTLSFHREEVSVLLRKYRSCPILLLPRAELRHQHQVSSHWL